MDNSSGKRKQDPRQLRKKYQKDCDNAVKKFCRTLLLIAKAMHSKNKLDNDINELYEQLKIAVRDIPMDVFELAGEYVWENRENIAKGNMKEFLRKDYKEEIETEIAKGNHISDSADVESVQKLISKIKRTWRLLNDTEQKDMTKKLQTLLEQYATWEGRRRLLKKLGK